MLRAVQFSTFQIFSCRSVVRTGLQLALITWAIAPLSAEPAAPPARPPVRTPSPAPDPVRVVSTSGNFALTFPDSDWIAVAGEKDERGRDLDLAVWHRAGNAFVKGRLARRHNRGIEGSLIDESQQAKFLIDFDPESVELKLSEEDYTGSALFCGRRRQGPGRRACSLVRVALHGRRVVQLHALIEADTPLARKRMLAQVQSIFDSLELLRSDTLR